METSNAVGLGAAEAATAEGAPSDEALIGLIAKGDLDALGKVYDRFASSAYSIAIRVLRDASLAEDAVQEAFLSVWRSAPSFCPRRGGARDWLLTLVHRRAVDLVRGQARYQALPAHMWLQPVHPSTDETAALDEERRTVQAALRSLPAKQREPLELAYYGGYSQRDIASRLDLPLGTVKSQMYYGLAHLRKLIPDQTGDRH